MRFASLYRAARLIPVALALTMPSGALAGEWQVTISPTTSISNTKSNDSHAYALGLCQGTSFVGHVAISGQTSSELYAQSVGAYSGSWTFTWVPNGANDWPSAYTIKSGSH